ncbi:aldo/keto reductase [Piscinibacter sp.]|uniref:aldo/keto reductase n=1 Tax=Piscinibacter sp. TaxID=1903157 RepID=UPI002BEBDA82|nr:aldo/keto reductase [Albitalea sp.]HUG22746.1 aldo/keto reductase [Albitalea sp.]
MKSRRIGPLTVSALGLGCMNLSHAYGTPPSPEQAERVLRRAVELGVTLFDTAVLYGFGANEELVGRVLAPHRSRIALASKCGLHGVDGKRVIDGRPATLKANCEDTLRRLRTDVIDLYYLHRWDKTVPIEESVGALADLVREGKVRALGLSEVSAATLRRAHAVHPVSALQNEYSLWTRNPEIAALDACRELGVSLVAFSPLARAYLTGTLRDVSALEPKDLRRAMPRFQPETYARNLRLIDTVQQIARDAGCTAAQLALAWLLAQDERIVPIPGTTRVEHLEENVAAADLALDADILRRVDAAVNRHTVVGARYADATLAEIDTEEFRS